jgi:hypothetical protein
MDRLVAIKCSSEAVRVDISVTLKTSLGEMKNVCGQFLYPTKIFLVDS